MAIVSNSFDYFPDAKRLGKKEYSRDVSNGQTGYLPSLEGIVKNADIVSEVDLGVVEIPLKKIIGTYSHLRSLSFARNFMPIIDRDSDFQAKWSNLCNAHLTEGIRDCIKVYEYLNWFYVIEGNKRVSVLKYFKAYSISANVIRLIPKMDENDKNIRIYYEFLKFNKITDIYSIWFTKEGSFDKLLNLLDNYNPNIPDFESKYKHFEIYIYYNFRKIYRENGGSKLPITSADAFIEYAEINGINENIQDNVLETSIKEFIKELEQISKDTSLNVQTSPDDTTNTVVSAITTIIPRKKLNVAFAYSKTIETSGWTYAHELGRNYLEKTMGDALVSTYIENVPENDNAYFYIKKLAEEGNDIIFTTSPVYMKPTLKCALEYPQIKFFNCSEAHQYQHVSNYFGRTYEPRFLTGIIAGALTKTDIIGYAATSPTPEVISSVNAFALGAKIVNPYAKIKVEWTNEWNSRVKFSDAGSKLIKAGTDIICNRTLEVPHPVSTDYGVYSMLCSIDTDKSVPDKYLATPIWQWGIFYEKIIRNILNDTFKTVIDMFSTNTKLINFWWGLAAGVVDIFYSKELVPIETQKLVELMKRMIMNNTYHPFTGPIYDQHGNIRVEADEILSHEQILTMDWFVDSVDTVLPEKENLF
ncbi:MAG: BMP family ABC transporter substrate-binding protein [Bacillota bacterium]|nr:BMP family ABC transporter substrate-binding protein [Bacillota bacterium]